MDTNLVLRPASTGNLTADETLADMKLPPMTQPMYLHCIVPSVTTSDVFTIKATHQDVSNNTLKQDLSPSITAAGHYVLPIFNDHPSQTDLSVMLDVTVTGTTAVSFGAVVVYMSNSRTS
jgi:hypothetical protein